MHVNLDTSCMATATCTVVRQISYACEPGYELHGTVTGAVDCRISYACEPGYELHGNSQRYRKLSDLKRMWGWIWAAWQQSHVLLSVGSHTHVNLDIRYIQHMTTVTDTVVFRISYEFEHECEIHGNSHRCRRLRDLIRYNKNVQSLPKNYNTTLA
jgi:glycine cleavage system aminomethyltransferase T